jgi:ABC-type Mn2+/Zn2+ transport system permease subunit
MLLLVALTVVVSFQTVGTLLVFGMLIAPASTGALLARRVGTMMVIACAVGIASSYLGLLASYWWDIAGGAAMVLVATLMFFTVFGVVSVRASRSSVRRESARGGVDA